MQQYLGQNVVTYNYIYVLIIKKMIKRFLTYSWGLLLMVCFSQQGLAQSTATQQKKLTALFSYATFNLVDGDPYIETYVDYDAWNLTFRKSADGNYQATVATLLTVSSGDSIVYVKKYDLQSPVINDTSKLAFNFIDLQRFSLKNGIYNLHIEMRDKASNNEEPTIVNQKIVVNYEKKPQLSSVQMMSRMTPTTSTNILSRGGYDMEPYVNDYLPAQVKNIYYYYEIYYINHEIFSGDFMTLAFIEDQETGHKMQGIQQLKRMKGDKIVAVAGGLDISMLPSGNYNLVVEVRSKNNELMMYKKVPFMRNNPGVAADALAPVAATFAGRIEDENLLNFYLKNLYPIASGPENNHVKEITKQPNLIVEKQNFLYNFWVARNPLDPEGEWKKYKERIDYVTAHFTFTNQAGYLTDCGRVYLQYGPPNFVRDEKNYVSTRKLGGGTSWQSNNTGLDKSTGHIYYLPFQMWRYDQLPNNQGVCVFVFWDEYRSGLYRLLQSNARGEVSTPNWERVLSQNQLGEDVEGDIGEAYRRGF